MFQNMWRQCSTFLGFVKASAVLAEVRAKKPKVHAVSLVCSAPDLAQAWRRPCNQAAVGKHNTDTP